MMNTHQDITMSLTIGLALAALWCSVAVAQPLPNGSFENGLNGWTPAFQGRVESLLASAFVGNLPTVPDGQRVALLSTGPGNVGGGNVNVDNNGVNDLDVTTLDTTLVFGFAPAVLRFDWAFATSEQNQPNNFDDTFGLLLGGQFVFTGSVNKPGGVSPFPDAPPAQLPGIVINSPGVTNGSSYIDGISMFSSACVDIPGAVNGNNAIIARFFVADQADNGFDSGLIIDNVRFDRSCAAPGQVTLQQITLTAKELPIEVKGSGLLQRFIASKRPVSSSDGSVVAFFSNANLTGDNPFFIEQVYTIENGAFRRETAFSNSCIPPAPCQVVQNLDIGRSGRWLAVAARATDGDNLEIYRIDRNNGNVQQLTNTSACDNTSPSINDDGTGIAFLSTCPGFLNNAGSNPKVVIWNNGSFINSTGAASCRDYAPAINGNNNRRYTAFASNCNHGGLNSAGVMRVFRFDRNNGNFALVDNPSPAGSNVVDINRDGSLVAYIGVENNGNLTAFRRDMGQSQAILVGASDPLSLAIGVRLLDENDGNDMAIERLDLLANGDSTLWHVDVTTQISTAIGAGSEAGGFTIARDGNTRWIHFSTSDDLVGQNPEQNLEIFAARIEP